jgi:hypothetical protein
MSHGLFILTLCISRLVGGEGHGDSKGSLVNLDVSGAQLATSSYEKEKPKANSDDDASMAKEQRAKFDHLEK